MTISMTGFGRATAENDEIQVKIEMKSVNNRYSDISIKLPRIYNFAEEKLKKMIKENINRGKIDVYVNINNIVAANTKVSVDMDLAEQYYQSMLAIKNKFDLQEAIRPYNISANPGVLNLAEGEIDEEKSFQLIKDTFLEALSGLMAMKQTEGDNIKIDMLEKINILETEISIIDKASESIVKEYKNKLSNRITEMLEDSNIDESRFNQEVAFFADRACIDEEITRLGSHIKQFRNELVKNNTGRKLDFIIQETNREINTIGSKANSLIISNSVLECKSIVEKLREQAMNIE